MWLWGPQWVLVSGVEVLPVSEPCSHMPSGGGEGRLEVGLPVAAPSPRAEPYLEGARPPADAPGQDASFRAGPSLLLPGSFRVTGYGSALCTS